MDGQQRDSYAALAKKMANVTEPTLSTRKGAYGVFVQLAATNISVSQDIPTTAAPYAVAPELPPMQVIASYESGHFRLTLVPNSAYPHPIALKA